MCTIINGVQAGVGRGSCFCPSALRMRAGLLGNSLLLGKLQKMCKHDVEFLYLLITAESISGYVPMIFSSEEDHVDQIENVK